MPLIISNTKRHLPTRPFWVTTWASFYASTLQLPVRDGPVWLGTNMCRVQWQVFVHLSPFSLFKSRSLSPWSLTLSTRHGLCAEITQGLGDSSFWQSRLACNKHPLGYMKTRQLVPAGIRSPCWHIALQVTSTETRYKQKYLKYNYKKMILKLSSSVL